MAVHFPPFKPCPCGSRKAHQSCCRPYLLGEQLAPTAEALMRSRYTAFVLKNEAYLLSTWHPDTRPSSLDLSEDPTRWEGLQVHRTSEGQPGDTTGTVAFTARYVLSGERHRLHEVSRFVRDQDRWLYLDGQLNP